MPYSDAIFAAYLKARARLPSNRKNHSGTLIFAPAEGGSLGDQAIITAAVLEATRAYSGRVVVFGHALTQDLLTAPADYIEIRGLFALDPFRSLVALQRFVDVLDTFERLLMVGTDTLDGQYSESRSIRRILLAGFAQRIGLEAAVIGFSFGDQASNKVRNIMRTECAELRLRPRDPLSAKRISRILGKEIQSAADIAFLLPASRETSPATVEVERFAAAMRSQGRNIVIFNANGLKRLLRNKRADPSDVIGAQANLLGKIAADPRLALILVPHEYRAEVADGPLLQSIYDHSTAAHEAADRILLVKRLINSAEAKKICSMADFVITGRMHLGIGALGVGVPTLFLNYQGKVEGLLEHFGLEGFSFTLEDVAQGQLLFEKFSAYFEKRAALSKEISLKRNAIMDLARRNFV